MGRDRFSPAVKAKVVLAAAETKSFVRAQVVLDKIGEIAVSSRHIARLAEGVGARLLEEQHERAERFGRKELPVEVPNPPEVAVVELDGGRIRTRAEGQGVGTRAPAWRESKNALFQRMTSLTHSLDPCPDLPDFLQNRGRVRQLVLEMSGTADGVEPPAAEPSEERSGPDEPVRYTPPKRVLRTCLASLDDSASFGKLMAAEAHRKGFFGAARRAFVADGLKCNWTVWKTHFPTFTPIVDLLHAVSYLYHAAVAIGDGEDFGWGLCAEWTRAAWQGRVEDVIQDLEHWLDEQPAPEPETPEAETPEDDPRRIVRRSLTYLSNNRSRMDYPAYRKAGLPISSALMESLVKEINWRVKGTEKFWNNPSGANPILALKAASLCDDGRLAKLLSG